VDPSGGWSAGLDVQAAEGFADHGNLATDLTDVLLALGEAARERGRGIVLLLDEVQFLSKQQLEALIQALHEMVQRKLPITTVGAGLPQIAELAGDATSYAERLSTFPEVGDLSDADARAALRDRLARKASAAPRARSIERSTSPAATPASSGNWGARCGRWPSTSTVRRTCSVPTCRPWPNSGLPRRRRPVSPTSWGVPRPTWARREPS